MSAFSLLTFPSPPPSSPSCLYISLPPSSSSCSSPPRQRTTVCRWLWEAVRRWSSTLKRSDWRTPLCLCCSGSWKFAWLCLRIWHTCCSHTATNQTTMRSRGFQDALTRLGWSLCQHVSHITEETVTLCNILVTELWFPDHSLQGFTWHGGGEETLKKTSSKCQLSSESQLAAVCKKNNC